MDWRKSVRGFFRDEGGKGDDEGVKFWVGDVRGEGPDSELGVVQKVYLFLAGGWNGVVQGHVKECSRRRWRRQVIQ